jgi:hypothetical protein
MAEAPGDLRRVQLCGAGLEQHVGPAQQGIESRAIPLLPQVEHDTPLVRVANGEVEAVAPVAGRQVAGARAARRLHADHVRSQVGEQATAELAALVGEIDDANAVQGSSAVVLRALQGDPPVRGEALLGKGPVYGAGGPVFQSGGGPRAPN